MAAVLLVSKTPLVRRLAPTELDRLAAGRVVDPEKLEAAAERQGEALLAVRAALAGEEIRERQVEQLVAADGVGIDLVVTVGGDGTVFTANNIGACAPYLTVNSDPERSVGHFARFNAGNVAAGVAAWRAGRAEFEDLHRLAITVGDAEHLILNDCLFAHSNPAVLCRYVLETAGEREFQRSSGVWISTAHGSTAAIHSAGATPVDCHLSALLYRVREPFQGRGPVRLLNATQTPPTGLRLTPAIPGMALYLDGPNLTVPVPAGVTVTIGAARHALRLVRLP